MEKLKDLLGYPNRKIYQNSSWFSLCLDSVLLANFVTILPTTKKILDIGTGTAPLPLILSLRTKAEIVGVEIQEEVSKLAKKSIEYNGLSQQIKIINEDIKEYYKSKDSDCFDVIVCNPPYFKVNDKAVKNQDLHKTMARYEVSLELETVLKIVKKLLKNDGVFALIHRTDRMIEIIEMLSKYGLEPKKIQLIYPKINRDSNLVLIEGRKNGKKGLCVKPPLIVHNENNEYTDEYMRFVEGDVQNESKKL